MKILSPSKGKGFHIFWIGTISCTLTDDKKLSRKPCWPQNARISALSFVNSMLNGRVGLLIMIPLCVKILSSTMRIFAIVFGMFLLTACLNAQDSLPVLKDIRPPFLILGEGRDSIELKGLSAATSQLIFMVFHAEQDVIGLDPGLSTDGRWRAIKLLQILKKVEFEKYFSTTFRNNILTLQPLTDARQVSLSYYDQADLQSLFKQIDLMGPDDLVMTVHQQTLPQIIERFTGSPWKAPYSSQPTDLIFIIERKPGQKGTLHTFRYRIR